MALMYATEMISSHDAYHLLSWMITMITRYLLRGVFGYVHTFFFSLIYRPLGRQQSHSTSDADKAWKLSMN